MYSHERRKTLGIGSLRSVVVGARRPTSQRRPPLHAITISWSSYILQVHRSTRTEAAPRRFFAEGILRARDRGSHEGAESLTASRTVLCRHDTYVACVRYVSGMKPAIDNAPIGKILLYRRSRMLLWFAIDALSLETDETRLVFGHLDISVRSLSNAAPVSRDTIYVTQSPVYDPRCGKLSDGRITSSDSK